MARTQRSPTPRPNRAFALLAALSAALVGVIVWSAHHLLLAGAPSVAAGGAWPGVACFLLPLGDDVLPHTASYAFLVAIAAGVASGARTLVRQHRQTRALLRTCLAVPARRHHAAEAVAQRVGLRGRLDVVDVAAPLAFCYGYLRPRVLVSRGLVAALPRRELAAVLLHEREHLRQRDPLKVALGKLCASGVFFFPPIRALYQRYQVDKELAADHAAIRAQGSATSLAAALAALLELGAGRPAAAVAAAGADEGLEARLDRLLGAPARPGPRLGRVPLLGSATILLLALLPLLIAAPMPNDHLLLTTHEIVNGCHLLR